MMDLFEAIRGRRSCRAYLKDAVEREVVEKILEAATWAPSPLNSQPWEFLVVTDQSVKEKIYTEGSDARNGPWKRAVGNGWESMA